MMELERVEQLARRVAVLEAALPTAYDLRRIADTLWGLDRRAEAKILRRHADAIERACHAGHANPAKRGTGRGVPSAARTGMDVGC